MAYSKTIGETGEFQWISELRHRIEGGSPAVLDGIGDDAAVLEVSDRLLIATCDIQIDGIHFSREWFAPEDIGAKVAAVNLSDIAAMGGEPRFALVSLATPPDIEVPFLHRIYEGMRAKLREFGAEIVGGNTAALPERLAIDMSLMGEVERDRVLRRRGAAPGDVLCVTGALGASRAGLMILSDGVSVKASDRAASLLAHRTPTPRIPEGRALSALRRVTACLDVSDGLVGDARHLAEQSDVGVVIHENRVPVAESAVAVARAARLDARELALFGGEDFELLFTVSKGDMADVSAALQQTTGTPATPIGEVIVGAGEVLLERDGVRRVATRSGFEHFTRRGGA